MPGWLTDHFFSFDFGAVWLSAISVRVPESQNYQKAQLPQRDRATRYVCKFTNSVRNMHT